MKIRSLAIVAAAFIVTAVTTPALAMYHPGMGRFMQRDPHGTMNAPTAPRVGMAGPAAAGGFVTRDPMPAQSQPRLQYADGMNLYQYVRSRPVVLVDPYGLLSLNETAQKIIANRPAGAAREYSAGLMLCLLWKESSFNERATNPDSSATGIAQILDGTADDIQDRVGPRRFGIPRDPFYLLPRGERFRDHRFNPDVSIYAAFLYLEDRRRAAGGDWKAGVRAYGPNGDKVIECSECCGIVQFDEDLNLQNPEQVQECLNKIHR